MRRVIIGCGMGMLAVCIVILAGHWTAAQNSPQAETTLKPSSGPVDGDEIGRDEESYDEDEIDEEEWDEDDYEMEEELLELELIAAHCEHAGMLSEMCEDHSRTASWVLAEIHEYLDEEEAAAFLEQILSKVEEPSVRRLIRLKLMELYSELDQTEQVKDQLRQLILGR